MNAAAPVGTLPRRIRNKKSTVTQIQSNFRFPVRKRMGIVTFQRLISCFNGRPPCASPAPFGGGGVCDSSVLPVFLIPGYTTALATGAP